MISNTFSNYAVLVNSYLAYSKKTKQSSFGINLQGYTWNEIHDVLIVEELVGIFVAAGAGKIVGQGIGLASKLTLKDVMDSPQFIKEATAKLGSDAFNSLKMKLLAAKENTIITSQGSKISIKGASEKIQASGQKFLAGLKRLRICLKDRNQNILELIL